MKKQPVVTGPRWAKDMIPSVVTIIRAGSEFVIMCWPAMPPEIPTKSYVTLWREDDGRIRHQITRTYQQALDALPQLPI